MSYRSSKLLLGRVNFYKTLGCPYTQPHPTILRGYQRQWEDIGIFPTHPHFFVPVYVNVCDYQNSEGFQQTDSGISFIKDQMNVKTISRWPPFHTKSHLTSDSENDSLPGLFGRWTGRCSRLDSFAGREATSRLEVSPFLTSPTIATRPVPTTYQTIHCTRSSGTS